MTNDMNLGMILALERNVVIIVVCTRLHMIARAGRMGSCPESGSLLV